MLSTHNNEYEIHKFIKQDLLKDIELSFNRINKFFKNYDLILFLGTDSDNKGIYDTNKQSNCKYRIINNMLDNDGNLVILSFFNQDKNIIKKYKHKKNKMIEIEIGHDLPIMSLNEYGSMIHLIDRIILPNIKNNNLIKYKNDLEHFEISNNINSYNIFNNEFFNNKINKIDNYILNTENKLQDCLLMNLKKIIDNNNNIYLINGITFNENNANINLFLNNKYKIKNFVGNKFFESAPMD